MQIQKELLKGQDTIIPIWSQRLKNWNNLTDKEKKRYTVDLRTNSKRCIVAEAHGYLWDGDYRLPDGTPDEICMDYSHQLFPYYFDPNDPEKMKIFYEKLEGFLEHWRECHPDDTMKRWSDLITSMEK